MKDLKEAIKLSPSDKLFR
jgi:hypothetical protein